MRGKRFFLFLVMILLGALLGLAYGWVIRPIGGTNSTPDALRYDYQADYVLMTAEIYAANGNLEQAASSLKTISGLPAEQTATQGLLSAQRLDWPQADLDTLEKLVTALKDPGGNAAPTPAPDDGEQP